MDNIIENTSSVLADYKVKAICSGFRQINHFNVYDLELAPGCKIKSIEGISSELQLRLRYKNKPIFIIDDGKIKMIFANEPQKVYLDDLIERHHEFYQTEVVFGIDYNGEIVSSQISKMPHMLVAGATGSGKSVFLHTLINNFLKVPRTIPVDFYLFDPKHVEFECYKHYKMNNGANMSVYNSFDKIYDNLKILNLIMEKRFEMLAQHGCKNIKEFNNLGNQKMKYIMCVIDEFADLIGKDKDKERGKEKKKFESLICSIASKSRAIGAHLILATQRPSVDVVTGLIKANFPTRVCFQVPTGTDSRVVLDQNGAENLMGNGDGLFYNNSKVRRFQGAFSGESE